MSTSVTRDVYDADGKRLYHDTWYSSYRASPKLVRLPEPVKKTIDPSLQPGEKVVDDPGVPPMSTSVTRDVYDAAGKVLYHDIWYSSYRAEPKLVRLGVKPVKEPTTKTPQQKLPH